MRWPAEYEPQAGILMAWPHAGTDWASDLPAVLDAYVALAHNVARFEPLVILCADADVEANAAERLSKDTTHPIYFIQVPYNDTWLRDTGPLMVHADDGGFVAVDYVFNAWGDKFEASLDDDVVRALFKEGVFSQTSYQDTDFALEGGAVETDGHGTLLATLHCLQARHPHLDRSALESILANDLNINRFLWLEHGALEGDDTDAHIDILARFASPESIVFQACDDPQDPHFSGLKDMREALETFRTANGGIYQLHALPWAKPIIEDERRLAASYANFLIVNGGIIMPTYGDPADTQAAQVLQQAFPGRTIVPTPARPFIRQNGSVHCLTMQLPAGSLNVFH